MSGAFATAAVFVASRKFRGSITKGISDQLVGVTGRTKALDEAIQRAFSRTEGMVPYGDLITLRNEHQTVLDKKVAEAQKLATLEGKLQQAQGNVDIREANHNKIKMGKEDCDRIADELRANRETLVSQAKKLENELEVSKTQMNVLTGEMGLTAEQQRAVNDLNQHLGLASMQFKETHEVFQQASQRFLNLQAQYQQLETEFKNLVEQQMSGGE